jgi:hypothetical protein
MPSARIWPRTIGMAGRIGFEFAAMRAQQLAYLQTADVL